ncbi:hypothetical protein R1sor_005530 [Riccia sorocarpa]|uniref:Uncharacterized protein n=1 Tax=Riccia sorocarpa TaxID=122646 RepID=A0ABD3HRE0_9MARC
MKPFPLYVSFEMDDQGAGAAMDVDLEGDALDLLGDALLRELGFLKAWSFVWMFNFWKSKPPPEACGEHACEIQDCLAKNDFQYDRLITSPNIVDH